MTDRTIAMTSKITTSFGPLHIGIGADASGFDSLSIDHNQRMEDSAVGKLLSQIVNEVNSMLKELRP